MRDLIRLKRYEKVAGYLFDNWKHLDVLESYSCGYWSFDIYHRFVLNGKCVLTPTHRLFKSCRCSSRLARRWVPSFLPF